jgi:hypothetical protein
MRETLYGAEPKKRTAIQKKGNGQSSTALCPKLVHLQLRQWDLGCWIQPGPVLIKLGNRIDLCNIPG